MASAKLSQSQIDELRFKHIVRSIPHPVGSSSTHKPGWEAGFKHRVPVRTLAKDSALNQPRPHIAGRKRAGMKPSGKARPDDGKLTPAEKKDLRRRTPIRATKSTSVKMQRIIERMRTKQGMR